MVVKPQNISPQTRLAVTNPIYFFLRNDDIRNAYSTFRFQLKTANQLNSNFPIVRRSKPHFNWIGIAGENGM